MKIRSLLILGALLFSFATATASAAESYISDNVHSNVLFRIKHTGISFVFGRFNDFEAKINWDSENPENSSVTLTIKAASIDTNNSQRDDHLRSSDFFNVSEFPDITFKSREISKISRDQYRVSGEVTLLGVTKPVGFTWTETGGGEGADGKYRSGGIATFTVNRSDFGMDFMSGLLSDKVEMTISLQNIRQ